VPRAGMTSGKSGCSRKRSAFGVNLLSPALGGDTTAYRSVARFARAATGTLGTSNSTDTRRDPHSGHISRLSRRESGKFGPRVQTRVCMSSGARYMQGRIDFIPSRLPKAHRAVSRQPSRHASPRVSTAIEQNENMPAAESRAGRQRQVVVMSGFEAMLIVTVGTAIVLLVFVRT
jgi:hypothetical protein